MDDRLPIGMFSRASSLSIKTLRAYHEAGILVPDSIDPSTSYRSYSVDQLADAAAIVRLRALDLPLAQVREVIDRRDPAFTRTVLATHRQVMQDRLAEVERIVAELDAGDAALAHTPVHVRDDPATLAVCSFDTIAVDELWDRLDSTFAAIRQFIAGAGGDAAGVRAAHYGPDIEDDEVESVEAFVPVTDESTAHGLSAASAASDFAVRELPAQRFAVVVHAGSYDDMIDTYRTLGAWVARNEEPSGAPVRERYLVGRRDVDDPGRYRTEIAWPVLDPR